MAFGKTDSDREIIRVEDLSLGYNTTAILENINFSVYAGEIVTILGSSGSGKSTLLKGMIGLLAPMKGKIFLHGEDITGDKSFGIHERKRSIGVLFQSGALLGSFNLNENIALPLREYGALPEDLVKEIVRLKLQLVHLESYGDYMPADLSGGMQKRAGLARAMALDPEVLFCDEPTAGLDPVTGSEIDRLLIEFNRTLGITMVVVTHELGSIEAISHRSIMLDMEQKGIVAIDTPERLKSENRSPRVQAFFRRKPVDQIE
ncbi:MAG: ATP-binding cassette domain-containing protein [Desulfobacterales bacterium]